LHTRRPIQLPVLPNLATHCLYIRRKPRRRHHSRMKIAIRTLRLAKRNLNVNPQPRTHLKNSTTPLFSVTSVNSLSSVLEKPETEPGSIRNPATHLFFVASLLHCFFSPVITFTHIFLSRGPSNSQKNTPCHCPNINFPSSTKIICEVPAKAALACESEFPSACR